MQAMLSDPARALLERWIYVMVKCNETFLAPYTPERLGQVCAPDAGYGQDFAPFLDRVCEALTRPGWRPGSYYPAGWYRALIAQAADPATVPIVPDALAPFYQEELRVDPQGVWYVGSKRIVGRVLRHFLSHLDYDAELGRYRVQYRLEAQYETRYLHHQSPPIRVHRVANSDGTMMLHLNTGRSEPLQAGSLRLDAAEQLYCAVGPGHLTAWFEDAARWEVLKDVREHDGAWVLRLAGQDVPVPLQDPWPYADAPAASGEEPDAVAPPTEPAP